jgi:hypothetical protein
MHLLSPACADYEQISNFILAALKKKLYCQRYRGSRQEFSPPHLLCLLTDSSSHLALTGDDLEEDHDVDLMDSAGECLINLAKVRLSLSLFFFVCSPLQRLTSQ